MIVFALLLQATAPVATPCPPAQPRCRALALARDGAWARAAALFEEAARAGGSDAINLWAQAGNAWLAAGEPSRAGVALDRALTGAETLDPFGRGELLLDRARADVATGDLPRARERLDLAVLAIPDDPLAWLLSATLARRMGDGARAARDIAQALRRAADDASVQLEAGNIAAAAGNELGARTAWAEAARLAPQAAVGAQARAALAQFTDAPSTTEPPPPPAVDPSKGRGR